MRNRTNACSPFNRGLYTCLLALVLGASAQASWAGTDSPNLQWNPHPCASCAPALLLPVPGVRQHTNYSCGEAALLSVLAYYGIDQRQDKLTEQTGTTYDDGTNYKAIIKVAGDYGLQPVAASHMTKDDLIANVKQGIPVIIAMQAWEEKGDPRDVKEWSSRIDDGHYIVAIGYDDSRIYFADPAMFPIGYITFEELDARWHDGEGDEVLDHFGIAISGGSHKPISRSDFVPID